MATLRIGYDLFAGSSQAGTDSSVPGDILLETAKALKYKLQVQRASDSYYWNATTGAFQSGAPAEADELDFFGSYSPSGATPQAVRRLRMKIPDAVATGITSAGFTVTAYATGDTPSSAGVDMTLEFAPMT
jgi:hypothetical protein